MTLEIPRAFHELDFSTRSKDQRNRWTLVIGGPAPALRPLPARSTVAAPENDHQPRSWSVPFSFAGHLASLPPCGVPRSLCQSASSSLLQPTFHVTSTRENIPFGDCPPSAVGKTRRRSTSRPLSSVRLSPSAFVRRRTTLRSSSLQRLARLTARMPASGPSTP